MSKSIQYSLRLEWIKVLNFQVNEEKVENLDLDFIKSNIKWNLKSSIQIIPNKEDVIVKLKVEYSLKEELDSFMSISVDTGFELNPFKDLVKGTIEKGNFKFVDENIASIILGLTFSTTRGILFEKLRGSILQQVPLPIINPSKLLLESSAEDNLIEA